MLRLLRGCKDRPRASTVSKEPVLRIWGGGSGSHQELAQKVKKAKSVGFISLSRAVKENESLGLSVQRYAVFCAVCWNVLMNTKFSRIRPFCLKLCATLKLLIGGTSHLKNVH